ncbi:MAG TPA: 2-(1,2-epoxy-1,2-dihydrophenyl)acetyl-CoA isomerase PaaG [Steroidobacteraceae bacterium]|nr:2-(1,2-epoxy-1,2-dihydrophenyl)acetyl-CoA isomerase PaaG [Steroidobacteraceae bacterium]
METILFSLEEGIARVTLNRPEKLNAFNTAMHTELRGALTEARRGGARVLILSGAGRAFSAGQDLADRAAGGAPLDLGATIDATYNPLVRSLRELPCPVIAAVHGVAAGAGASVALACDLVIAGKSASFIQAFGRIGLLPDSGGTWNLPRLVGTARALGLALTGERLGAEQAAAWGMIWRCVEDAELGPTVEELARQLATAPTRALASTKEAIYGSWQRTLSEQLDVERDMQRELGMSEDFREGVAAFLEKRAARFKGR